MMRSSVEPPDRAMHARHLADVAGSLQLSAARSLRPFRVHMYRVFVLALSLSCFATAAWAQAQSAAPAPTAKPAAKKLAAQSKSVAKPAAPADSGPCGIGVISAIGDQFGVQKVGITVFGNDLAEAPINSWGLDDITVERTRAAAPGTGVRKIAYAKGAFAPC